MENVEDYKRCNYENILKYIHSMDQYFFDAHFTWKDLHQYPQPEKAIEILEVCLKDLKPSDN